MFKEKIDEKQDYYQIMELTFGASDSDIKKAYYSLSKKFHPDLHPEGKERDAANEKFQLILKAYSILKEPELKAQVDAKFNAKKLQSERLSKMDVSKRKLREELEEREKSNKVPKQETNVGDLDKLRQDGYKELFKEKSEKVEVKDSNLKTVTIKWENQKVSEKLLKEIFEMFGKVEFVMKKKDTKSATISFIDAESVKAVYKFNWKDSKFDFIKIEPLDLKKEIKTENYEMDTLTRLKLAAEKQKQLKTAMLK